MRSRKLRTIGVVAVLPLLLGITACSGGAANQDVGSDATSPIRVAVLSAGSGPYADFAAQQKAGIQFAADEVNATGGVDGHPVELYMADTLGTAEGAVAAGQKLVQQDQAKFITGLVASPVTLALMQRLDAWGAVQFGTQSQGVNLTGADCTKNFFRVNTNDDQIVAAMAAWLEGREPIAAWDAIGADYAFGRDSVAGLDDVVSKQGGEVATQLFAPLGTTDFGSYIGQLNGGGGLLVANSGGDSINFLKQALQFGTFEKYDLVLGNASLTNSSLAAVNDERLVGAWGTANWLASADTPQSVAFVDAYTQAVGTPPADFTGAAYMAMQTLFAGVKSAGSIDPIEVRDALEGLTFETIKGEVTMRAEDHQMQAPIYLAEVVKGDDGIEFMVKDAIEASTMDKAPNPACQL